MAQESRALSEMRQIQNAIALYRVNNRDYSADATHGLPDQIAEWVQMDATTPVAPFRNSYYDWNVWESSDGRMVYQLSIRFCDPGATNVSQCSFPRLDWAENFTVDSSFFYCFDGPCQAHRNRAPNHPGYCFNCDCQQMEAC